MKIHSKKNILHVKAFIVTVVLLLTTASSLVAAESGSDDNKIIQTYSFEKPQINHVTIEDTVYDQIIISDASGCSDPGEPDLPAVGVKLLLPQGTEITDINITPGEKVFLGSNFNIIPSRMPLKLSETNLLSKPVQDELIYTSEEAFPESLFTEIGTYVFRGYEILVLTLYPVQYMPASGDLYYFRDMTVIVKTEKNGEINPLFRNLEMDSFEIIRKVDNPLTINSYTEKTTIPVFSGNYNLLILTPEDLKDHFTPLKNAHDAQGISTEIKTLRDISIFPDSVTPEDIRDFIKEEYTNSGIEYVLIGGDNDIVPAKDLWVRAWNGGDTTFMPSDLYYACLDGTYNYDGDDQWGEPDDGEDGNDVDLIAEVYLGRACVGSTTEVDNFVDKTTSYINSGGYSDGNVLMVGEFLWDDPDTWGGDYMDEMINGSNAHYTTVGIPSSEYTIDTLYDRDWPGHNWPKSEIVSRINTGARIINHLGHSSYSYNMKMDNSDVSSLSNSDPCFVYSQGCMAGGFDNDDCIAEYFTVKTDNAAFAVIMNARYGWGVKGSTDGPSQHFHRQFWDAVFGESIPEIGKANHDSKEDNLNRINGGCMRWCYYQTNLFGDPTLTFYTSENNDPNKPARPSGETRGSVGEIYVFTSSTTDVDNDRLYYKWDFGDGTFSEWLGPYDSGEEVNVSHEWSKIGIYQVKVKARDEHRAEGDWSEPLSLKMPMYNQFPLLRLLFEFLEKCFPQIFSLLVI